MRSPDTRNISLLRGVLRIDVHSAGAKTGYIDIGEADKFDLLTPDINEIEQFTSRDGSGAKVKGTITKFVPKFEISGQELSTFNLALQTLGIEDLLTQGSGNVTTQAFQGVTGAPKKGRSYFFPHRNLSNLVLSQGAPLTPGTDYVEDLARGMVYFPSDSGINEAGAAVTGAYDYGTVSLRRVRGGAAKTIECSMFYTGDSADGLIYDCEVFRGLIKPSANLSLIQPPDATEYARWGITGDILSDAAGNFGGSSGNPFFSLIEAGVVS